MNALRDIDEIAYVRYASVYRSFEDVAAFSEEVEKLKNDKRKTTNVTQLSLLTDKITNQKE